MIFHALVNSLPRYKAPVALETVTWTQPCRYINPLAINENTLATLHIHVTNIFKKQALHPDLHIGRAHSTVLHTGHSSPTAFPLSLKRNYWAGARRACGPAVELTTFQIWVRWETQVGI